MTEKPTSEKPTTEKPTTEKPMPEMLARAAAKAAAARASRVEATRQKETLDAAQLLVNEERSGSALKLLRARSARVAQGTGAASGEAERPSDPSSLRPLERALTLKAPVKAPETSAGISRSAVCGQCQERRYVLYSSGEFVRAKLCDCRPVCSQCQGRGYSLKFGDNGYAYHSPCDCRDVERRIELFNRALIPSHYTHKDLTSFEDTVDNRHALTHVRAYAREYPAEKSGLLLVGDSGTGKTHLLVGLLKILTLEKGIECLFKDFFLLLSEVRQSWDSGRYESDLIRPLTDVDVLVVDELGKGRSHSDWEQALLDEIICKRYNQMKTTLLTTNFPLELREDPRASTNGTNAKIDRMSQARVANLTDGRTREILEQRVGERIFSRLKQMCTILRVPGADYRRTHAAGTNR